MKILYLLVYTSQFQSREKIKHWADNSKCVSTWRTDLPNSFYIVSDSSADEICADMEAALGNRGRYLLAEITDNRQGRLPPESWFLLKNKVTKTKEVQAVA